MLALQYSKTIALRLHSTVIVAYLTYSLGFENQQELKISDLCTIA